MTGENRLENARAEIAAARDALRVAAAALQLNASRDAMSRAYYAAFHAARALVGAAVLVEAAADPASV